MSSIITSLPERIEQGEEWLLALWAQELGVSVDGVRQAVSVVGPELKKVRRYFYDGFRIAIRDDSGKLRLAMRMTTCNDGFGISVPYHPSKHGWLFKMPYNYEQRDGVVRCEDMEHYEVHETAKLSIHMSGFAQFSGAGGKTIISGYNQALQQIKGLGVRAPDPIQVSSGPLFGIVADGLPQFDEADGKRAEAFEPADFWFHPLTSSPDDTAYNIEGFMFQRHEIGAARIVGGKRILTRHLPFYSQFKFPHHLRVIEFAGLPVFIGIILSRHSRRTSVESGYRIGGPGCGGPGEQKFGIGAEYPFPDYVRQYDPVSLDAPAEADIDK